jgi:hypothetical protein
VEHQRLQVMVVTVLLPQLRVRLSLAEAGAGQEFLVPLRFLAEGKAVGEPVAETAQHLERLEQQILEAEAEELVGVRVGAQIRRAVMAVPVSSFSASLFKRRCQPSLLELLTTSGIWQIFTVTATSTTSETVTIS